ncbi:MAG: glucosaminidase domain-containing protein [Chitinophagaceae bacterium]
MVPETENQRVIYPRVLRASRLWLVAGFLFFSLSGFTQTRSFIQKYRPLADSLSVEYGIPASVILSIAILESASGTSRNCRLLNNFFGIVGKNNLLKTRGIKSRYKQYENDTASFVGFCKLQTKKKYYKKLRGNTDYRLWTDAISKSGYSEVPSIWKKRVNDTIRKNKLSATR